MTKIGRNDPCWCGSGKKYKRCHLLYELEASARPRNQESPATHGENRDNLDLEYDVCLSFAGEDREYVSQVAEHLALHEVRVFYDAYERAQLWGKDLYQHLDVIYQKAARYCVIFISHHYASKLWASHELKAAQARAFHESHEYILPARFDNTELPGLRSTVGYIDLRSIGPIEFAHLIMQKIGPIERTDYFPLQHDRLLEYLQPATKEQSENYQLTAYEFMATLRRMTPEERAIIFVTFLDGCKAELPDNMHIDIELLRRHTGFTRSKLRQILAKIGALGFTSGIWLDEERDVHHLGVTELVVIKWAPLKVNLPRNATDVAHAMLAVGTDGLCKAHARAALDRLDFSQLASATYSKDSHLDRIEDNA